MTQQEARSLAARAWGRRIKALRTERCMTQDELAQAISKSLDSPLTRVAVTHWESGRHEPSLRHRRALAAVLDVPVSILFELPASVTAA